jgi:hypothetical protein
VSCNFVVAWQNGSKLSRRKSSCHNAGWLDCSSV